VKDDEQIDAEKALNKHTVQEPVPPKSDSKKFYKQFNDLTKWFIEWWFLYLLPKRGESYNVEINNPYAINHLIFDEERKEVLLSLGEHKTSKKRGTITLDYSSEFETFKNYLDARKAMGVDSNVLFLRMPARSTRKQPVVVNYTKQLFKDHADQILKEIHPELNIQMLR
jgi:hypothetical protein